MKKFLGVALCALFLTGCNSSLVKQDIVQQLVKVPEVKGISLNAFSPQEQSVSFNLDLYNPNLFPLPVSGLQGDFQLNGISVGALAAESQSSLAAQSTQTVTLPIKLNTSALSAAVKKALTSGKTAYNFSGGVKTSVGEVPVSKSGELSIGDLTKVLLQ